MLADADPTGTITINNSEFADNGNRQSPADRNRAQPLRR